MEGDDEDATPGEDFAAEADGIVVGDADGGGFANGPVDADFAFLNLAVGFPAGELGARGNELVEANFFHGGSEMSGDKKAEPLLRSLGATRWVPLELRLNQERGIKLRLWSWGGRWGSGPLSIGHARAKFDAFETLHYGTLSTCGAGCFETVMLRHENFWSFGGGNLGASCGNGKKESCTNFAEFDLGRWTRKTFRKGLLRRRNPLGCS